MDATAHYRNLVTLGRSEFLASSAPAALVRRRHASINHNDADVAPLPARDAEIYPLVKKAGASFPDRITIGRTPNNDIVIADDSISRLHAYVRRDGSTWMVGDAGSKHGSWLAGDAIAARKEHPLRARVTLRIGEVSLQFILAGDLYAALGGAE